MRGLQGEHPVEQCHPTDPHYLHLPVFMEYIYRTVKMYIDIALFARIRQCFCRKIPI